jgi:hypothetical protein
MLALGLALAIAAPLPAQTPAEEPDEEPDSASIANAPLFASHDVLEFTLIADFKQLRRDRGDDAPERPAKIVLAGSSDSIDLQVRTRGQFRLQRRNCSFPPIRLNFKTGAMAGTMFATQDRNRLVVPCQETRDEFEQYVLHEYVIYRMWALLSDLYVRARLARVTYVDTGGDAPFTRYSFILESFEHLAKRTGWMEVNAPMIPPDYVHPDQMMMVDVFMYMIGNLDWDPFMREPDEDYCCHNIIAIGDPAAIVYPVPYDFDFSGLVNATYATPPAGLGVRRVTDRLNRGICKPAEELAPVFAHFNAKKDAIYALYQEVPGITDATRQAAIAYLDRFYETINDPRQVDREFVRKCRKL